MRWAGLMSSRRSALVVLAVATAVTAIVGVLDGQGWPSFVMGAILALVLWVMLFAGSYAVPRAHGRVEPTSYAAAAAVGVVVGYALVAATDNSSFWAVGAILAGAVFPATSSTGRDRRDDRP